MDYLSTDSIAYDCFYVRITLSYLTLSKYFHYSYYIITSLYDWNLSIKYKPLYIEY